MKLYCISIKSRGAVSAFLSLLIVLLLMFELININSGAVNSVLTNDDRVSAISMYGYDVLPDAVEVKEIVIPEKFNDVYEKYNQIQIKGGFNLKNYSGERATLYKYQLRDSADAEFVNIIICDGIIIGGDVSSARLDGEMKPL